MKVLEGKSVYGGIAIGRISIFDKGDRQVKRISIEDTAAEIRRFDAI